MQYWYSAQLRQYRLQFIRAFSNFYVKTGRSGPSNTEELIKVPCRYGDPTRIAASIVRGNSENKILSVPFISCFISGLNMSAARRQDPQLVVPVQVNERRYDNELGRYTNDVGNRYTVDRYMPVPYDLTMQVDIWTENQDIKEQLLEQILVLYNPAIDIQTSVNPIDWTVLSYIEMQDSITWSSRSIPVGTENPIDVATMIFKIPIWINPPAKVKKQSIIHQIVTNIVQGSKDENSTEWTEYEFFSRTITTPENATIKVEPTNDGRYVIYRCSQSGDTTDPENLPNVTFAAQNPQLFSGMSFVWNGKTCTINSNTIDGAVADIREAIAGTNLNAVVYNETSMQLINTSGDDNVFVNVAPGSLEALGIEQGTYVGGKLAWWRLLQLYGSLKTYINYGSNASQLRLKTVDDLDQTNSDLVGWIDIDQKDHNKIYWTPDPESFPRTTISPIDAIIDPQTSGPNINLPMAAIGQRYLLTQAPSESSVSWGQMSAQENDVIEFDGNSWAVSFDASQNEGTMQYVYNTRSGRTYQWKEDHWSAVVEGRYLEGYWRLAL